MVGFLTVGFLAVETFFATGLTAVLAAAVGLTPAALALTDNCRFMRAALFLDIRPFLMAVSIALCALLCEAGVIFLVKSLSELLRVRLVLLLRIVALRAVRTRFFADWMMGMLFLA